MAGDDDQIKNKDGEGSSGGITYDSPYYLLPSGYPKQLHVNEVLTDNNFADWSQEMTNFLFAKNKIEFVDGTIKKPEKTSKDYMPWMRVDAMIKGWLTTVMEKNIQNNVKYAGTSSEIWSDLNERFGKESAPRAYELKQKIASTRQGGASDERQRAVSNENINPHESATFKAFQRRNGPLGSNKERSRTKAVKEGIEHCTECNKDGHKREGCFKLIGYPKWWPEKKGEKTKGKAACAETETSPISGLTNEDNQYFLKHFSGTGNSKGTRPIANMAHKEDTEDSIPVKRKGDYALLGGTKVNVVLYVLDFKCNLLSGLQKRNLIGARRCRGGLYRMKIIHGRKAMATTVEMWHRRLGHASKGELAKVDFLKTSINDLGGGFRDCRALIHGCSLSYVGSGAYYASPRSYQYSLCIRCDDDKPVLVGLIGLLCKLELVDSLFDPVLSKGVKTRLDQKLLEKRIVSSEDNPESHSGSMSSMKNLEDTDNFGDQFLYDKPIEDDQEKSKVRDESDSTIPDPTLSGRHGQLPPLILPALISQSPTLLQLGSPTSPTTLKLQQSPQSPQRSLPFIPLQLRLARLEQSNVLKFNREILCAACLESIKNQESEKSQKEIIKIKKEQDTDSESEHGSEQSSDTFPMQDERAFSVRRTPIKVNARTGKKKLCKADLEGPPFNLVKAFHKNSVFLQYQIDECHKLLTNKVDLSNPEGHQIPQNINEPLPLGGPAGQWFRRKEFYINKHSEPSDREAVRSQMRILSVISVKVFEKYGYNYLREIILRRADYKEYKISEKDFKNLHPNDFEDLFLLNIQEKLNHLPKTDKTSLHTAVNMWIRNLVIRNRVGDLQLGIESYQTKINLKRPNWDAADYYFKEDYTIVPKPRAVVYRDRNDQRKLMRLNELHKFSDGTLTRVMEKLDHMVKDFHLFEYNKGMETRKWSEDDKRRSKDFITAIEKRLQIRRIFRSLESFVGGRIRDIDYRLINRTT
ncbi:LTR copia-type gag-polypeptide [Tanacetum coccineum]